MDSVDVTLSPLMTERSFSELGHKENQFIRMSHAYMNKLGLNTHQTITLEGEDHSPRGVKILKVCSIPIGHMMSIKDADKAMITSDTYADLKIKDGKVKILRHTIGCDPECFLYNSRNGSLVSAEKVFPKAGMVASDGNLLEFRPMYSFSEACVTNSLGKLIVQARKIMNSHLEKAAEIEMKATSYLDGEVAGFHVHLGLNPHLKQAFDMGGLSETVLDSILSHLSLCLDYHLAIPAMVAEGPDQYKRRASLASPYGRASDIRYNFEKLNTFEYRVLGGHILRKPELTTSVLSIAACIASFFMTKLQDQSRGFETSILRKMYSGPEAPGVNLGLEMPALLNIMRTISSRSTITARGMMNQVVKNIKSMGDCFEERCDSIMWLFNCIDSRSHIMIDHDMEKQWGANAGILQSKNCSI